VGIHRSSRFTHAVNVREGIGMRIIYLAKHDSGGNDDEGAITFALEKLGHEVVRVPENKPEWAKRLAGDFLLCHHLHDLGALNGIKIPKVFWCFDLIEWDNSPRHKARPLWIKELTKRCDLGFCTDGDWVAKDDTGKLHWLTQGADEREFEKWTLPITRPVDVLFVGGIGYGRDKFVEELRAKYGEKFKHVLKGCYGPALEYQIRSAKIVVAPDSPVTDQYWSNRVYNVLRMGGFLLHSWSEGLAKQYSEPMVLVFYKDLPLCDVIDKWLSQDYPSLSQLAGYGQHRTMNCHTYRHRCVELIRIVKERLCLK
jgi:hypothetical protein